MRVFLVEMELNSGVRDTLIVCANAITNVSLLTIRAAFKADTGESLAFTAEITHSISITEVDESIMDDDDRPVIIDIEG